MQGALFAFWAASKSSEEGYQQTAGYFFFAITPYGEEKKCIFALENNREFA